MEAAEKAAERKIKLLRVCDGLHLSLEMLRFSYAHLWPRCHEIRKNASNAVVAIQHCWSFIDSLHRLRELAKSIPTISQKHLEIRVFLEATELAEVFRHYVQHLSSELGQVRASPSPVWGTLSWVDGERPNVMYSAFLGTDIAGTSYPSGGWVYGENRYKSKVLLTLNDKSFYFDDMFDAAMRFGTFVDDHVKPPVSDAPPQPTGLPVLVYEVTEVDGGIELKVQQGLVVRRGVTDIRAPRIEMSVEVGAPGDGVTLQAFKKTSTDES